MNGIRIRFYLIATLISVWFSAASQTEIWSKKELSLVSTTSYDNPLYEVEKFYAVFVSPSGRSIAINGFWDGGKSFKIRFAPDELGVWSYRTYCSKEKDAGLHALEGKFECVPGKSEHELFRKGAIQRIRGEYHLRYSDGSPFFYTACTAWNGALLSTEEEWDRYLRHRVQNGYNVIQFVATQWGGGRKDIDGNVAFTGSSKIQLNAAFFQRLDKKVDRINQFGLVAAPVLLWALPVGHEREFHPGYYLPDNEAILLARYIVARYGGNQIIWILGGDGQYTEPYVERWLNIGRGVFSEGHPGVVAQHPRGKSWIGDIYKEEPWVDIVGYQSGHSNQKEAVDWINKGPVATQWDRLPARPLINLEPNYEEIGFKISATDVRNASYWSVFAAPLAGIAYGANGIWPWVKEAKPEKGSADKRQTTPWFKSIDFPGSMQIGYLSRFIQRFEWWTLKPAPQLLASQPGDSVFNHFVSVVANNDLSKMLLYTPLKQELSIRNPHKTDYIARWFDPIRNEYIDAGPQPNHNILRITPPSDQDYVLILEAFQRN